MDVFPEIKIDKVELPALNEREIKLSVARLDLVHPVVSGNKLFKLHYFLQSPELIRNRLIITAGGAYSNHLVATAFACQQKNIACVGIVRGDKPALLNASLRECMQYGMKLHYVSRSEFSEMREDNKREWLKKKFGKHLFIHEGGFHPHGAQGAGLIAAAIREVTFTHLCCAIGTGTTIAGIAGAINKKIVGFPVLKGMKDVPERFEKLNIPFDPAEIQIAEQYHFGGYASHTPELLGFMNKFFHETGIPTDFVYTGKMMFGVMDMISKGEFPEKSEILCIHTGGLQGNRSLETGILEYARNPYSENNFSP